MKKPVLTKSALRVWLAKRRNLDRQYTYLDNYGCLVAEFVKSQGFKKVKAFSNCVRIGKDRYRLPNRVNAVVLHLPHTYRAALERASNRSITI